MRKAIVLIYFSYLILSLNSVPKGYFTFKPFNMQVPQDYVRCSNVASFTSTTGKYDFNQGKLHLVITHPETGNAVSISGNPSFVAMKLDEYSELWKVSNFPELELEPVPPLPSLDSLMEANDAQ